MFLLLKNFSSATLPQNYRYINSRYISSLWFYLRTFLCVTFSHFSSGLGPRCQLLKVKQINTRLYLNSLPCSHQEGINKDESYLLALWKANISVSLRFLYLCRICFKILSKTEATGFLYLQFQFVSLDIKINNSNSSSLLFSLFSYHKHFDLEFTF